MLVPIASVQLYSEIDDSLIAWTSVKLPFEADIKGQFQCSREYLGLLLTMFLIARALPDRSWDSHQPPITFRWVNDNSGALVWADKHKTSSLSGIVATMAVTSFQLLTNISFSLGEWIPGLTMGDIDHESRREEHIILGDYSAPSLGPDKFIDLESIPRVMDLANLLELRNMLSQIIILSFRIFNSSYRGL